MQRSFAELEFGAKKKRTRRERFLAELDALTPWAELQAQIEPFYPRGQGRDSGVISLPAVRARRVGQASSLRAKYC